MRRRASRFASATRGDAAVLQLTANSVNLNLTEASFWRISDESAQDVDEPGGRQANVDLLPLPPL